MIELGTEVPCLTQLADPDVSYGPYRAVLSPHNKATGGVV